MTSDAGLIGFLSGHVMLAQRIWGQDSAFLSESGERYRQVMSALHVKRARWYLARGRAAEGRADVAAAGDVAPLSLRLLAGLPAPLMSVMGAARRTMRGARPLLPLMAGVVAFTTVASASTIPMLLAAFRFL